MLLDWDQLKLAERSKVSIATIKRLEAQPGTIGGKMKTVVKIKDALEKAGVTFIQDDTTGGAGVRLTKPRNRIP